MHEMYAFFMTARNVAPPDQREWGAVRTRRAEVTHAKCSVGISFIENHQRWPLSAATRECQPLHGVGRWIPAPRGRFSWPACAGTPDYCRSRLAAGTTRRTARPLVETAMWCPIRGHDAHSPRELFGVSLLMETMPPSDAPMKISCADYTWPRLRHDQALSTIRSIGVRAVDVALFARGSHLDVEVIAEDPLYWAGRIQERVERHGLVIADVFLTPGPNLETLSPTNPLTSDIQSSRRMFRQTAEFARKVGSPGITLLPGIVHQGDRPQQAFDRAAKELAVRVQMAHDCGLRCSFEPHFGSLVAAPAQALELVRAVSGLEITLDTSHFVYQGFGLNDIAALIPHTRHVQVRPARRNHMQVRVHQDESDIPGLINLLYASSYEGFMALEYVWMETWECDRVDNTTETVVLNDLVCSLMAARPR